MDYRIPTLLARTSQGDFSWLPQVRVFDGESTSQELEDEVNSWLTSRIVVPDIVFHIAGIDYQLTGVGGNAMYSAMIHFIEEEII